ncbi:unnamed protein product [Allacma fusca]|uniref:DUF5641 domain-containing protein n=1 Tax=Allacma fusca TaxID=39272 RepID=A0A8J2L2B0_9HEXA|nr:unnamed protein product [Allacma fusca]
MCALAKDDELAQIQIDFESVEKTFDEERVKLGTLLETVAATSAPKEVQLPKLELPTFSGNPDEWIAFRELFVVAVHDNPVLKGSQKLQYLLLALKEKAANCVQTAAITDSYYASAWDRVNKRFHNKHEILKAVIHKLMSQPSIKTESPTAFRALADNTNECVTIFILLERAVDKWDHILVYILVEKLDDESRPLVKVWDASGGQQVIRAMLDNGSQVAIITSSCVQRPGLPWKRATINVTGISNCNAGTSRGRVELQLSSCVVPTFRKVDILLGADVYGVLRLDSRKSGPPGTPLAMNFSLGWVVLGPTGTSAEEPIEDMPERAKEEERIPKIISAAVLANKFPLLERFSSLSTLVRVTAYILRFVQHSAFPSEIKAIARHQRVHSDSNKSPNPFLDQELVLRVGRRLDKAKLVIRSFLYFFLDSPALGVGDQRRVHCIPLAFHFQKRKARSNPQRLAPTSSEPIGVPGISEARNIYCSSRGCLEPSGRRGNNLEVQSPRSSAFRWTVGSWRQVSEVPPEAGAIPEEDDIATEINRLSRWQLSQKIVQHFWKRWSSEYLSRLQQRPKWLATQPNLRIGDLVLVQRKRRIVGRIKCRNVKNDCPPVDCSDAVSVPGKCCKICPEKLKSYENITSDGLLTDDIESNENNKGSKDIRRKDLIGYKMLWLLIYLNYPDVCSRI